MIEEEVVLKILALGLPNETPSHRIAYLLKKLYGKDGLSLDIRNTEFFNKIVEISKKIK